MPGLPIHASVVPRSTYADIHALWDIGAEPEGHPNTREELRTHYHRIALLPYTRAYAAPLVQALGLVKTQRVLVVGGLFGFLSEVLRGDYGFADGNLLSLDTSPFIVQEATAGTEELEMLGLITGLHTYDLTGAVNGTLRINDGDGKRLWGKFRDPRTRCRVRFSSQRLDTTQSVTAVKQLFLNNTIDVVITDDGYLNYHNNSEITEIFTAVDQLGAGRVCHLVYPDWGNGRPLAAWKTMSQAHAAATQKPVHTFVDFMSWQVL